MSFILVPSNSKNILNDNFTIVSEIKERSQLEGICNPLDVMDTSEGDIKSAIYKIKTRDFIDDTMEYITNINEELEKDFVRMKYLYGNKPFSSLEEFKIFLNDIDDQEEKKLLSVVGVASCLGIPMTITSKSISHANTLNNTFFFLAEMSSPMVTKIHFCSSSKKWNIHVTKNVRCCAQNSFSSKNIGTSFGVCSFDIVRKGEDPENTYISIDFLRLPRLHSKRETFCAPLLDLRPTSVIFSHH
jgi:hypothetical protein